MIRGITFVAAIEINDNLYHVDINSFHHQTMAYLDILLPFVRNGTAEGDKAFLDQVFIQPGQLRELVAIEGGGLRLLVGNKGIGKSALLEWVQQIYTKNKISCLMLHPDDLDTADIPLDADVGALKRHFYLVLLHAICARTGADLKAKIVKGEAATLYKEAREAGLRPTDLAEKTIALIDCISTSAGRIDAQRLAKEVSGGRSAPELIRAISTHMTKSGSIFYLLIDDTDQVAAPGTAQHLNRIWALMLAARRLAMECSNLRVVISLRSEVWSRLTSDGHGQRDQTDHLRGSVIWLRATEKFIEDILRKRLQAAADMAEQRGKDPYTVFFSGPRVKLPTSDEERSWETFLVKSSRERPRDAIQLIKNMIDVASLNKATKMSSVEADKAMRTYSSERVDDLVKEFSPDCDNIRGVLGSFSEIGFENPFSKLSEHLQTIPSRFPVIVRGRALHPLQINDALILLNLLHEAGFMNPRLRDDSKPRGFKHILFHENPHFVSPSNRNELDASAWEIHPAFRSYLLSIKALGPLNAIRT